MKLRRLLAYAWPYRLALALTAFMMIAQTVAVLGLPWLGGQFAAGILANTKLNLDVVLAGLIGLFALRSLFAYFVQRQVAETSAAILADLRQHIYHHIQNLPLSFFREQRQGDILTFAVYEPEYISRFLTMTLTSVVPNGLAVLGAFVVMASIDPVLAGLVLLLVPLFYIGLRVIGRKLRPLSADIRDAYSALVSTVEENLSMMPVIKAFTREEVEADRHQARAQYLRWLAIRQQRLSAALTAAIQFLAAAAMVVLLRLLGDRVTGGDMSVADFVSFLLYAAFLTSPFSSLANIWADTQNARGALTRLEQLFQEKPEATGSSPHLGPVKGNIRFENVYLTYPGNRSALRGVTLDIPAGQTLALVGANGAGKSSLVNLLMRFDQPERGRVMIDGTDIASVGLRSLREQIAVLSQTVLLFNASIAENIGFGRSDASAEQIEAAARRAQAHRFITELPQGYETLIGDRGIRLSGGQAQRIALARALLKDPAVLVLDEPTAMFDPEGEDAFIADARQAFADRTVILITHRPGSLALADRIVTLDGGAVVADSGAPLAKSQATTIG